MAHKDPKAKKRYAQEWYRKNRERIRAIRASNRAMLRSLIPQKPPRKLLTADLREYQRKAAEEMKRAGICIRCRTRAVKPGRVQCKRCLKEEYARVRANHLKRINELGYKAALNERRKRDHARDRRRCMEAYGGLICACCGEREFAFLTIDHVNGGGSEEAKKSRTPIYVRLRRAGYPPGYQILCYNCNCGRHRNGGVCPHKAPNRITEPSTS